MSIRKSTLTFITESLPTFFVGVPVNFTVEATGGDPPYTFTLGQTNLPARLNLKSDGSIQGVARRATNATVDVKVTDSAPLPASVTQAFAVEVAEQAATAKS